MPPLPTVRMCTARRVSGRPSAQRWTGLALKALTGRAPLGAFTDGSLTCHRPPTSAQLPSRGIRGRHAIAMLNVRLTEVPRRPGRSRTASDGGHHAVGLAYLLPSMHRSIVQNLCKMMEAMTLHIVISFSRLFKL